MECSPKCETISVTELNAPCILAFDNNLLLFTSSCVNCPLARKDGMFRETPSGKMSQIVKPLSVMTISPGCKCWRSPQSAVIALSEALPPYRSLTKVITPLGATPITALSVVRPLYWLYKWNTVHQASLCYRRNLCAVEHDPAVREGLEAIWQRCLILGYGGDVILKKTNIQNIIQGGLQ